MRIQLSSGNWWRPTGWVRSHQRAACNNGRVELDLEMVHGAAVHSEKRSTSCLRRMESWVASLG